MDAPNVNNLLPRLQRWYFSQCNEEWEHSWGVKIDTLDNPGWSIKIDLEETDLEWRAFTPFRRGLDEDEWADDWLMCWVKDKCFEGSGGPEQLAELIAIFLEWAEQP